MKTIAQRVISLLLCLLPAVDMRPQGQAPVAEQLRDDYIGASLLVCDPSDEVYSLFGHCALRLSCPSRQMDYCFTFETSADTKGTLSFLSGKAKGGFMAATTANFLEAYRHTGRGVTEYTLHLTPQEKLRLWKTVDDELARGYSRRYNYMHTQCTSMCIALINRAVGTCIKYNMLPQELQGSFREVMLSEAKAYPWSTFCWQTIMGPEGDSTEPQAHKLTPRQLPQVWQHATVGSEGRPLIASEGRRVVDGQPQGVSSSWLTTPTAFFALVLLLAVVLTVGQFQRGWRKAPVVADALLLAVHTLTSLFLLWLVCFSQLEATGWNWYLLPFNLLPQVFWLVLPAWRKVVAGVFVAVLLVVVLLTPFVGQLDCPHALLIAAMAVRLSVRTSVCPLLTKQ